MSDSTNGTMVRMVTCSTCILCTCSLFLQSFPDKSPSDVGVVGILEHISLWYDLAVKLGVPYAKVEACQLDSATGGNRALVYWRNGNWGEDIPNTWGFLLETVDHLNGPLVAKQQRDEANKHKTWSLC